MPDPYEDLQHHALSIIKILRSLETDTEGVGIFRLQVGPYLVLASTDREWSEAIGSVADALQDED